MSLYREVAGDGPTVVLVHAGVCDSRMWDPQWAGYTAEYRTVRYDLRGFGRSPLSAGTFSHARDLATLLDELGIDRATLVAASYGSQVALELAVARPDLVNALVVTNASLPGHDWSDPVRAYFDEEETALARGDIDAAVEANLRMWVDGPARRPDQVDAAVRNKVGEMQRHAFELQLPIGDDAELEPMEPGWHERLTSITAPTLVLVGELDVTDIHTIAARLTREMPAARSATIPGAAHLPSLERPAEFDRHVLPFLADSAG